MLQEQAHILPLYLQESLQIDKLFCEWNFISDNLCIAVNIVTTWEKIFWFIKELSSYLMRNCQSPGEHVEEYLFLKA